MRREVAHIQPTVSVYANFYSVYKQVMGKRNKTQRNRLTTFSINLNN